MSIEDVTGERPFSNPLYSKSDVRTLMLIAGIPNVNYGPLAGDLATTGGKDEWVTWMTISEPSRLLLE